MKKNNVYPLILLFIFITGCLITTPLKAQPLPDTDDNLRFISIPAPSLENNLLGVKSEQKIAVCTPFSYYRNESMRFPVIYFLTGYGDEPAYYTNGMYQHMKLHTTLKDLSEKKSITDMIVVIIGGSNFIGGCFYTNSEVGGNWEDFIIKDVVSYVDNNFRTIAEPSARGISGHSMGGSGALNISIKHPELFGAVYALSPGLFDKNGLEKSQMFSEPYLAEKFLKCEKDNSVLTREKAQERLTNFCDNSRDLDLLFMLAYGIAFAPNSSKNAPYIDFPYSGKVSKANLNKEIWKKWDYGFGGWEDKLKTYKDNILKIKSIGVEYGTEDDYKWIVDGCKFFIKLFADSKIPLKSVSFKGGHQDKLRERMENFLLPFFSAAFKNK